MSSEPHGAWHMPLPDSLGQVKVPVRQMDLSRVFLYILYKENIYIYIILVWQVKNLGFVEPCLHLCSSCVDTIGHINNFGVSFYYIWLHRLRIKKPGYIFPGGHCLENLTNSHVSESSALEFGASLMYTCHTSMVSCQMGPVCHV